MMMDASSKGTKRAVLKDKTGRKFTDYFFLNYNIEPETNMNIECKEGVRSQNSELKNY